MADNQRVDVGNLSDSVREGSATWQIETAKNKDYIIVLSSRAAYELESITAVCGSGSCSYTAKIAGENVAGLVDKGVTSSSATSTPSGTATIDTGESFVLTVSNVSSAVDLVFQFNWRRDIP